MEFGGGRRGRCFSRWIRGGVGTAAMDAAVPERTAGISSVCIFPESVSGVRLVRDNVLLNTNQFFYMSCMSFNEVM